MTHAEAEAAVRSRLVSMVGYLGWVTRFLGLSRLLAEGIILHIYCHNQLKVYTFIIYCYCLDDT